MSEFAKQVSPVSLEREMRESYLAYAMSVIVGRALPDVRDGLKPVHRRVLFAMNVLSNDWNKPYKKSARVVGDVIGKYHPHGDSAVYDTIVRMAQDFSLRYTLVDGQGNFGSVDGDAAAAMRYTEIRMARIAHDLMADLDKETVDFSDNYDGTEQIPDVFPTQVPNLLINGSSGIAVGMATNIPPHNLREVIDACVALLDNEDISIDELTDPGVQVQFQNDITREDVTVAQDADWSDQFPSFRFGSGDSATVQLQLNEFRLNLTLANVDQAVLSLEIEIFDRNDNRSVKGLELTLVEAGQPTVCDAN